MKRVGIDVGGTFTDLIYVDEEKGEVLVPLNEEEVRQAARRCPGPQPQWPA